MNFLMLEKITALLEIFSTFPAFMRTSCAVVFMMLNECALPAKGFATASTLMKPLLV